MNNERYFKVTCKCGHVGKRNFVRINFPVIAVDGKGASAVARYIPRVKHDHKDAILDCTEISIEEFEELQETNRNDPYLRCGNKQEQWTIENFASRLEPETRQRIHIKKERNADIVSYKRRREKARNNVSQREIMDYIGGIVYEQIAY